MGDVNPNTLSFYALMYFFFKSYLGVNELEGHTPVENMRILPGQLYCNYY